MGLRFIFIENDFRKKHKLSMPEYALCDMIYHLSTNPAAPIKDWCTMTKEHMAEEIGISKKSILNFLEKLIEVGFVEKNEVSKYLRTTAKWNEVYFTDGVKIAPSKNSMENITPTTVNNFPNDGVKNALYNNNNNNTDNNKLVTENLLFGEIKEEKVIVGDLKTEFLKEFNRVKCSLQPTRVMDEKATRQLKILLKAGYTIQDIGKALENAMKTRNHKENKFVYLTPEFITRPDKFNIYHGANFENTSTVRVNGDSDYEE
jgi:hypothetical protein